MSKKNTSKILIVLPLILIMLIIVFSIFYGKHKVANTYDISEIFQIEILGTEGYGYANISISPYFLEKSGISLSEISYKISRTNNLSNGDWVEITADKIKGIYLKEYTYKYQVSGLEKGTDLNIFKDLVVNYDADTGALMLDNSQCSEFIKENVIFNIKRQMDKYQVGDVVEIIGYVDMNAAADNKYNIISTIYEYTVQ